MQIPAKLPADPPARLRAVGTAIHGSQWQSAMAALLTIDRKTLYRWLTYGPPADLDTRLAQACRDLALTYQTDGRDLRELAETLEDGK